ncbi:hypothetical protein BUE80_DR005114 [Diplocarpon rosae]|nr:hypothetical protein BUE80_DR005114 [Diplocarpon rosae]
MPTRYNFLLFTQPSRLESASPDLEGGSYSRGVCPAPEERHINITNSAHPVCTVPRNDQEAFPQHPHRSEEFTRSASALLVLLLSDTSRAEYSIQDVDCPKSLFQGGIPDLATAQKAAINVCTTIDCTGAGEMAETDFFPTHFIFRCYECPLNMATDVFDGCTLSKGVRGWESGAAAGGVVALCTRTARVPSARPELCGAPRRF